MTITIEDASITQLDDLFRIETECFKLEAFAKSQIAQLLTAYNSIGLVAKDRNRIVGFIIGIFNENRSGLTGHILTIDVSPFWRRKGVGERLLHSMEQIFREKGIRTSILEVKADNSVAMNLYEKLGYKKIGKLTKYYGHIDGICLSKTLM